jgi:hypothetical protein
VANQMLQADFNGVFGDVLCLSHSDTCLNDKGEQVLLQAGITATAFEEDVDENGNRDDLVATGTVEPSPDWLQCNGSRWILRMDALGVRHRSDL